jgi:hypothetical protein
VLTDVFLLKMPIVFIDKSVREKVATWIAKKSNEKVTITYQKMMNVSQHLNKRVEQKFTCRRALSPLMGTRTNLSQLMQPRMK